MVKGHNQEGKNWTIGITKPVDDSTQQQNELQQIIEMSHEVWQLQAITDNSTIRTEKNLLTPSTPHRPSCQP